MAGSKYTAAQPPGQRLKREVLLRSSLPHFGLILVIAVSCWALTLLFAAVPRLASFSSILPLLFAVVAVGCYSQLQQPLRKWVDRQFFRVRYNSQQVLEQAQDGLLSTLQLDDILAALLKTIQDTLGTKQCCIYLSTPGEAEWVPVFPKQSAARRIVGHQSLIRPLRRQGSQAVSLRHLTNGPWHLSGKRTIRDEAERIGAKVLMPLSWGDRLLGFVVVGKKRPEAPFSIADLEFLTRLAQLSVLPIRNALSYLEIEEINQWLEKNVADRTRELERANEQMADTNAKLNTSLEGLQQAYGALADS